MIALQPLYVSFKFLEPCYWQAAPKVTDIQFKLLSTLSSFFFHVLHNFRSAHEDCLVGSLPPGPEVFSALVARRRRPFLAFSTNGDLAALESEFGPNSRHS